MGNFLKLTGSIKLTVLLLCILVFNVSYSQTADTSNIPVASPGILKKLIPGKAPILTIQLSFHYNNGLMDLAANDNASFRKEDFVNGRNFGTRYGYGGSVTGKYSLQKEGYARLTLSAAYDRFMSNFVIAESPEGKVSYNVLLIGLGLENNFTPDRKYKFYVGGEFLASFISGSAVLKTDSSDFNLTIKNSMRLGLSASFGFEYAISNNVGINLGMKLTHANLFLKQSKASTNPNETFLNDAFIDPQIPFAGWKQFFYGSFFGGINLYFGMKNKK